MCRCGKYLFSKTFFEEQHGLEAQSGSSQEAGGPGEDTRSFPCWIRDTKYFVIPRC